MRARKHHGRLARRSAYVLGGRGGSRMGSGSSFLQDRLWRLYPGLRGSVSGESRASPRPRGWADEFVIVKGADFINCTARTVARLRQFAVERRIFFHSNIYPTRYQSIKCCGLAVNGPSLRIKGCDWTSAYAETGDAFTDALPNDDPRLVALLPAARSLQKLAHDKNNPGPRAKTNRYRR
jgi:hypothetical protein